MDKKLRLKFEIFETHYIVLRNQLAVVIGERLVAVPNLRIFRNVVGLGDIRCRTQLPIRFPKYPLNAIGNNNPLNDYKMEDDQHIQQVQLNYLLLKR